MRSRSRLKFHYKCSSVEMAAFLALGKTLEDNAVGIIFSYLEDCSFVTICNTDASDIANLDDLNEFDVLAMSESYNNAMSQWLLFGSMEFPHRT